MGQFLPFTSFYITKSAYSSASLVNMLINPILDRRGSVYYYSYAVGASTEVMGVV